MSNAARLRMAIDRIKLDHPKRDANNREGEREAFIRECFTVCQNVKQLAALTGYKVHHIRKTIYGDKVSIGS